MKCPFCTALPTQVKDSRLSEDNNIVRRRRMCKACGARFTTFEKVKIKEMLVIKKNGDIEIFNHDKFLESIMLAVKKRSIPSQKIESLVNDITQQIESLKSNKVSTSWVGELIMSHLLQLDLVSYIRFASVYMNFKNTKDFVKILQHCSSSLNTE